MSNSDDTDLLVGKTIDDSKREAFTQSPSCSGTDCSGCHWVFLNTPNDSLDFGREFFRELLRM